MYVTQNMSVSYVCRPLAMQGNQQHISTKENAYRQACVIAYELSADQ